ncbi:MAG: co-chaperone GroES [Salinivirgaceae bacterium]|nr:co-chaperone GroES [Salinivirgaceae bacterium]
MAKLTGRVIPGKALVLPVEKEEKTAGGIYIPDSAKDKPQQGEIVILGDNLKDEQINVKVGDNVMYGKYSGTEVEIDGTKYMLISTRDIIYIF